MHNWNNQIRFTKARRLFRLNKKSHLHFQLFITSRILCRNWVLSVIILMDTNTGNQHTWLNLVAFLYNTWVATFNAWGSTLSKVVLRGLFHSFWLQQCNDIFSDQRSGKSQLYVWECRLRVLVAHLGPAMGMVNMWKSEGISPQCPWKVTLGEHFIRNTCTYLVVQLTKQPIVWQQGHA